MEGALKKESHERSDEESLTSRQDEKIPARQQQNSTLSCKDPPTIPDTMKTPVAFSSSPVKKTRKKDKNKPKRPLSAYNLFFKDERIRYLKEEEQEQAQSGPKDKFLNMSREIGRRWMNLSRDRRKLYEALAEEATFRYRVSMDAYQARKQLEDANLLHHRHPPVAAAAASSIRSPNQDARSTMGGYTVASQMQNNPSFGALSSAFNGLQRIPDSNHKATSALDSFLLANHASTLPTGLPMHTLHSAASREQFNRNNDSLQAAAGQKNLLDYLLLEKLAQNREREQAEDATTMRLRALLNARRPDSQRREDPSMFLPASRWLYENVVQSLHSSFRAQPSQAVMNQLTANKDSSSNKKKKKKKTDQEAQQEKELLEFVRRQQNPQWAAFLNQPENPNPNAPGKP